MSVENETKSYDLSKVHEVNLKLLKEIDRICRKYKIKYALDAGTLLGAIRHGGFIPWDDDVDIVMTRKNYEMFAKVVRRELAEGMTFVEPNEYHNGEAFFDFVPRILYDKSQKFAESEKMAFYDDKISKLWVDIFILDALPGGKIAKPMTKLAHCVVYGLALGHCYQINYSDYQGVMKLFVGVLSNIGKLVPFPVVYTMWNMLCRMNMKKDTPLYFYTNYAPNWYYVEMERAWDDQVKRVPFENTELCIPEGWEQCLTQLYGDYMKLPPKEKQVPEHSDMEIKIYG